MEEKELLQLIEDKKKQLVSQMEDLLYNIEEISGKELSNHEKTLIENKVFNISKSRFELIYKEMVK